MTLIVIIFSSLFYRVNKKFFLLFYLLIWISCQFFYVGDSELLDLFDDDTGPPQTRVTRSSSFPVDPKILHRNVSQQQSLDSDDEMKIRQPVSLDDSTSVHTGMKGIHTNQFH